MGALTVDDTHVAHGRRASMFRPSRALGHDVVCSKGGLLTPAAPDHALAACAQMSCCLAPILCASSGGSCRVAVIHRPETKDRKVWKEATTAGSTAAATGSAVRALASERHDSYQIDLYRAA
jgi:hypothetical protein